MSSTSGYYCSNCRQSDHGIDDVCPKRPRKFKCYVCGKRGHHNALECPMRNQRIQFPGAITPIWKKRVPLVPKGKKIVRLFIDVVVTCNGREVLADIEMEEEMMIYNYHISRSADLSLSIGKCIFYRDIMLYEEPRNDTVVLFCGIRRRQIQFRFQLPMAKSRFIDLIKVFVLKSRKPNAESLWFQRPMTKL